MEEQIQLFIALHLQFSTVYKQGDTGASFLATYICNNAYDTVNPDHIGHVRKKHSTMAKLTYRVLKPILTQEGSPEAHAA